MKELQIMKVVFNAHIAPHETPAFRGAVIEKVGLDRDIYHNHDNNPETPRQFHYRYPLVQYRQDRKRPALVFIDQGINEASFLFAQSDWSLTFAGRTQPMSIADLQVRQYPFGVTEDYRYYTLHRWQALNDENYRRFMATDDLTARIAMLQRILEGHVISLAKGVNHRLESRFDCIITDILGSRPARYEGVQVLTFDIRFKTNLLLPPYIALGKGVSLGFGEVRKDAQKRPRIKSVGYDIEMENDNF